MKCENCKNYEYCVTYDTECNELEDECTGNCENCHYKDYCSTDLRRKPNLSEIISRFWLRCRLCSFNPINIIKYYMKTEKEKSEEINRLWQELIEMYPEEEREYKFYGKGL